MAASVDPIRIVAAIATDTAGRLLVVRKAGTTTFMLPCGKPEPGEAALATLEREIAEEIGCRIAPDPRFVGAFEAPAANEPGRVVAADLYRVELIGTPIAGAEIAELLWLDAADLGDVRLAPLTATIVLPLLRAESRSSPARGAAPDAARTESTG